MPRDEEDPRDDSEDGSSNGSSFGLIVVAVVVVVFTVASVIGLITSFFADPPPPPTAMCKSKCYGLVKLECPSNRLMGACFGFWGCDQDTKPHVCGQGD